MIAFALNQDRSIATRHACASREAQRLAYEGHHPITLRVDSGGATLLHGVTTEDHTLTFLPDVS